MLTASPSWFQGARENRGKATRLCGFSWWTNDRQMGGGIRDPADIVHSRKMVRRRSWSFMHEEDVAEGTSLRKHRWTRTVPRHNLANNKPETRTLDTEEPIRLGTEFQRIQIRIEQLESQSDRLSGQRGQVWIALPDDDFLNGVPKDDWAVV